MLTCGPCADGGHHAGTELSPGALAFLAAARQRGPAEMGTADVAPAVLAELERLHRALMARHLERELKSPRVLRQLGIDH